MPEIKLDKEQRDAHRQRLEDARTGAHFVWAQELDWEPEAIHRKLIEFEQKLAAPHLSDADYGNGVAKYDDHHEVELDSSGLLLSSEHATVHWRTDRQSGRRDRHAAEIGTAGLAALLAHQTDSTHMTMLGRQTRDANHDVDHPYRRCVNFLLQALPHHTFVSVHGIARGYVSSLDDERSIDILLGTGVLEGSDREPPESSTVRLGNHLQRTARQLNLRAELNHRILKIREEDEQYYLEIDDDGRPRTRLLNAPPHTTRGAAEQYSRENQLGVAAVQVELASTLRLVTREDSRYPLAEQLGAALGFLMLNRGLSAWLRGNKAQFD